MSVATANVAYITTSALEGTRMDNATLTAKAKALAPTVNAHLAVAQEALIEARARQHRLVLAEVLLDADLPRTAVVEMTDWADEPNDDGTYDLDPGEAYDPETDEVYGDLGGQGAVSAGHHDGNTSLGTDWDIFLTDDEVAPGEYPQISVAKVYDWLAAQSA